MLTQLLYVSVSNLSGPAEAVEEEITRILSTAYLNNRAHGLTGILFHCENYFVQLIEGAEEEVFNAFAAIKRDSRHRDVKLVYSKAISEPAVPSAAMGCAGISGACPDLLIPTLLKQGNAEAHEVAASSLVKQMLQRARTGDIELPPVASIKPATQRQTH